MVPANNEPRVQSALLNGLTMNATEWNELKLPYLDPFSNVNSAYHCRLKYKILVSNFSFNPVVFHPKYAIQSFWLMVKMQRMTLKSSDTWKTLEMVLKTKKSLQQW